MFAMPGGCAGDRPGAGDRPDSTHTGPFICTGYPDVAGLMDSLAPVEERYRINGGATFGLFFTALPDQALTGYTRRFFTYQLDSFGGLPDWHVPYFSTSAFRRSDHTGTYTTANGPGGSYTAVKLP